MYAIQARLETTDAGGIWAMAAKTAPNFFQVSALLFPRKLPSIVRSETDREDTQTGEKKDAIQKALEEITKEKPWQLGFSEVSFAYC